MPKKIENKKEEIKKIPGVDEVVDLVEERDLNEFLGGGEVEETDKGIAIDTGKTEEVNVSEAIQKPKTSKAELKKLIEDDPEFAKEILGLGKEKKINVEGEDKLDKLAGIVSTLAESILKGQNNQGTTRVSNKLQTILGQAERQAMANIQNYKKKFQEEIKNGEVGDLLIFKAFGRRLPTRSLIQISPDGKKVKETLFEIGFRGVTLAFALGKKYKGTPNSIIEFVNKKVAAYQDVVNGSTSNELTEQAFNIKTNAIS